MTRRGRGRPRTALALVAPAGALSTELGPELERAQAYARASIPERTRDAYRWGWTSFAKWALARELEPLRASDVDVATFLAWAADGGLAPKSVHLAYDGVSHNLRAAAAAGWPLRGRPPACAAVLRGISRTSPHKTDRKRALVAADLVRVLGALDPDGARAARDRALLLIGWAGAFRRSELVALDVDDIAISQAGVRILVRRSKTDQDARGLEKGIARGGSHCPVAALERWMEALADRREPTKRERRKSRFSPAALFTAVRRGGYATHSRLTTGMVGRIVQESCRAAGLGVGYGAHSLRAGFVTEAAARHKSLDAIMRQTGHRSIAQLIEYIRHADIFEENASDGLLD